METSIHHRTIADNYIAGRSETTIPQDSRRQIWDRPGGRAKYTTDNQRQMHCPGQTMPQDVQRQLYHRTIRDISTTGQAEPNMPQDNWRHKYDGNSVDLYIGGHPEDCWRQVHTTVRSKTHIPQDGQRQLYHRTVGDKYTTGQSQIHIPENNHTPGQLQRCMLQEGQGQIYHRTVGDNDTTDIPIRIYYTTRHF